MENTVKVNFYVIMVPFFFLLCNGDCGSQVS